MPHRSSWSRSSWPARIDYRAIEGVAWWDASYMTVITLTTVGSGRLRCGVVARIVTSPHDANQQDPHLPMRYDTGRPWAVIRFKISQPRTTSLPCPAGLRARRPPPMMDLYRPGSDRLRGQPHRHIAATNEGPVVGRPIRNAVLRLIRGMNLRLHPCSVAPAETRRAGQTAPPAEDLSCNNALRRWRASQRVR